MRPAEVMDDLLATVLAVEGWVIAAIGLVGLSTVLTSILVFLLSLRLRRAEIDTMVKIGGARSAIVSILGLEVTFVLVLALVLALALTAATAAFGTQFVESFLIQ